MIFIDQLFQIWVSSHWAIALAMSTIVNISIFVVTAFVLSVVIKNMANGRRGKYINAKTLNKGQKKWEIGFGITACFIFALGSLASRELFHKIWPETLLDLCFQTAAFILFYEIYSYFVHLLLHSKPFKKYHAVHHRSVRVTPWSAYSVHPLEAMFIGFSAPLFMLIFPLSLGVALVLHVFGMMFTIFLHSNFVFESSSKLARLANIYPSYHAKHHTYGTVNFGFIGSAWDSLLKTGYRDTP